jgi:hypothetical protein
MWAKSCFGQQEQTLPRVKKPERSECIHFCSNVVGMKCTHDSNPTNGVFAQTPHKPVLELRRRHCRKRGEVYLLPPNLRV